MKEEAESLKWDLASFSCIPIQSAPPAKLVVLIFSFIGRMYLDYYLEERERNKMSKNNKSVVWLIITVVWMTVIFCY